MCLITPSHPHSFACREMLHQHLRPQCSHTHPGRALASPSGPLLRCSYRLQSCDYMQLSHHLCITLHEGRYQSTPQLRVQTPLATAMALLHQSSIRTGSLKVRAMLSS